MKRMILYTLAFISLISIGSVYSQQSTAQNLKPFIGDWALEIDGGWYGWLSVWQEEGYVEGELLWRWGSVQPVESIYLDGDELVVTRLYSVVRTRDENDEPMRKHVLTETYRMKLAGENILTGVQSVPKEDGLGVSVRDFKGMRAPAIKAAPDLSKIKFGEPRQLFNGKDLDGWKIIEPDARNGFKVIDGALVNDPVQPVEGEHLPYGNLRTVDEFGDFQLTLDVNVPAGSNSGIYLRGMYEVQVLDSYGKELDSHHMGALYSRIAPSVNAEKPAGEWQHVKVILYKRHLSVWLNVVNIIDNQPVRGITGGAIQADVAKPGPIYLQGDHGKVSYRHIVLTPIVE